jgi:hypothetical protein
MRLLRQLRYDIKVQIPKNQRYNPFNPVTKIKYSIPVAQTLLSVQVQLKIYDILGKEVTVLVNMEQEAGILNPK